MIIENIHFHFHFHFWILSSRFLQFSFQVSRLELNREGDGESEVQNGRSYGSVSLFGTAGSRHYTQVYFSLSPSPSLSLLHAYNTLLTFVSLFFFFFGNINVQSIERARSYSEKLQGWCEWSIHVRFWKFTQRLYSPHWGNFGFLCTLRFQFWLCIAFFKWISFVNLISFFLVNSVLFFEDFMLRWTLWKLCRTRSSRLLQSTLTLISWALKIWVCVFFDFMLLFGVRGCCLEF